MVLAERGLVGYSGNLHCMGPPTEGYLLEYVWMLHPIEAVP